MNVFAVCALLVSAPADWPIQIEIPGIEILWPILFIGFQAFVFGAPFLAIVLVILWFIRESIWLLTESDTESNGKRWSRRYVIGSSIFVVGSWLYTAPIFVLAFLLSVMTTNPWLSMNQGPDTSSARAGIETALGEDASKSIESGYYVSHDGFRDGSKYIRFKYSDDAVLRLITERFGLVQVPQAQRTHRQLHVGGSNMDWWPAERINALPVVLVDQRTWNVLTRQSEYLVNLQYFLWLDEVEREAFLQIRDN